ncbi:Ionotropic receptor 8a [Carabus blaptoides fortunei]
MVVDVTWGNVDWVKLYQTALYADLPYLKMDLTIGPTLRILDAYLQARNGTDVTIIFETTEDIQEALFYWVDRTSLRMIMMEGLDDVSAERLKTIRPLPSFYVVIAETRNMVEIIKKALNKNLIKLAERWILVFLDMEDNSEVKSLIAGLPISLIYYDKSMCCAMQKIGLCDECPSDFVVQENFLKNFVYQITNYLNELQKDCKNFTLKESFWFALTSFTPQGGGEAPKALSGRTLVAAYWLFVVLMLATFTANLAAFLTVERMQSPVQSLEQLAKQSRINYTVKAESWAHQYFINMKFAEDTLYRLWKELTLNASTAETQYRVWDYPIREQYGHILLAINDTIPVDNATQGFQKVVDHIDADFAFIHDASEIKYEISRNCNLTEIGEVFAERPYAVAVQQGSHMSDELSKAILDLQKDRFFEDLKAKYWNHSAKGVCSDTEDSEGITLESLGGVFIATLFGLALAMLTLFGEVIYYKRKKRGNKITDVKPITEDTIKPMTPKKKKWSIEKKTQKNNKQDQSTKTAIKDVTIGSTFQPVLGNRSKPASDSFNKENYLTVYSGSPFHPDKNWYWDRNFLY